MTSDAQRLLAEQAQKYDALRVKYDALAAAARDYFDRFMQDEADPEFDEWVGCSREQHEAAKRLGEALPRAAEDSIDPLKDQAAKIERLTALCDLSYARGVAAGWNCETAEQRERIISGLRGPALAELKLLRDDQRRVREDTQGSEAPSRPAPSDEVRAKYDERNKDILPCPYCGNTGEFVEETETQAAAIQCTECPVMVECADLLCVYLT